jgi:hypothetical protein
VANARNARFRGGTSLVFEVGGSSTALSNDTSEVKLLEPRSKLLAYLICTCWLRTVVELSTNVADFPLEDDGQQS